MLARCDSGGYLLIKMPMIQMRIIGIFITQVIKLAERKRLFEGYHSFEGCTHFFVHVTLSLS